MNESWSHEGEKQAGLENAQSFSKNVNNHPKNEGGDWIHCDNKAEGSIIRDSPPISGVKLTPFFSSSSNPNVGKRTGRPEE